MFLSYFEFRFSLGFGVCGVGVKVVWGLMRGFGLDYRVVFRVLGFRVDDFFCGVCVLFGIFVG